MDILQKSYGRSLYTVRRLFSLKDFSNSEIELVIRILYRLRFLSEQAPLDVTTFSYAFPLLSHILTSGGIPGDEGDDPAEQVALTVEILKFHSGECECPNKFSTLSSLLFVFISFGCCLSTSTNYRQFDSCVAASAQP